MMRSPGPLGVVFSAACLIAGWVASPSAAAQGIRLVDAAGTTVRLAQPARRIVSLAPHVSELLFEVGAGDVLVGAVQFSDYPPAAAGISRIGDYKNLDMETLLALRPDLVIGWLSGNRPRHVEQIRALGLPVYLTEPRRLARIPELMRDLGMLSGRSAEAEVVAAGFERRLQSLRERYAGQQQVSVFFQAWDQPLMTLNGDHLVSDAIALCGGVNVFADLERLAPTVSIESVLVADPAVIVTGGVGEERSEWLERWRQWPQLRAVRQDQLYLIDPDLLQRPTSRILQGLERLCEILEKARAGAERSSAQ